MKPSLAFATMCKNEEHCIRQTLDSVAPYVDYIVVCDTGSTDNTVQIVKDFFSETGIKGEVFVDEWIGFDHNKNLMMERVYNTTDYLLHLDADDYLMGNFSFLEDDRGSDLYLMTLKRKGTSWKATVVYNNRLRWKFIGVAHTIIRCTDRESYNVGDLSDRGWIDAEERGARKEDPMKYLRDAERLSKQFWDTAFEDPHNLNSRSAFYTAQSYADYGMHEEAIKWYSLYIRLRKNWVEETFEAQMRISLMMMHLNYSTERIIEEMKKAINLFPDRAEPYFHLGMYMNQQKRFEEAYRYLSEAKTFSLEEVEKKYSLFVQERMYGKFLNDELSVACYWLGRFEEGYKLLMNIVEDPDFAGSRERLLENKAAFEHSMGMTLGI
jgi:glycosyltransferase involved in cell wall biosynthesis